MNNIKKINIRSKKELIFDYLVKSEYLTNWVINLKERKYSRDQIDRGVEFEDSYKDGRKPVKGNIKIYREPIQVSFFIVEEKFSMETSYSLKDIDSSLVELVCEVNLTFNSEMGRFSSWLTKMLFSYTLTMQLNALKFIIEKSSKT